MANMIYHFYDKTDCCYGKGDFVSGCAIEIGSAAIWLDYYDEKYGLSDRVELTQADIDEINELNERCGRWEGIEDTDSDWIGYGGPDPGVCNDWDKFQGRKSDKQEWIVKLMKEWGLDTDTIWNIDSVDVPARLLPFELFFEDMEHYGRCLDGSDE